VKDEGLNQDLLSARHCGVAFDVFGDISTSERGEDPLTTALPTQQLASTHALHRRAAAAVPLWPGSNNPFDRSYGMNVFDMNGDGFEDRIVAPGVHPTMPILMNMGSGFVINPTTSPDGVQGGNLMKLADFDGDGLARHRTARGRQAPVRA
jgi:hypothetical protein